MIICCITFQPLQHNRAGIPKPFLQFGGKYPQTKAEILCFKPIFINVI